MLSMCNRTARFVGVLFILTGMTGLLPWATTAVAGQGAGNPAGIAGVVTDNSGAVLPGVTVTATGPALQVPSVTVSRTSAASTVCRRCLSALLRGVRAFRFSERPAGGYAIDGRVYRARGRGDDVGAVRRRLRSRALRRSWT